MSVIYLTLGDWSNDGHGRTERFAIESNLPRSLFVEAYEAGASKLGVNVMRDVACDYEDGYISEEDLQKFRDAGFLFKFESDFPEENKDPEDGLDQEQFVELFLFTVKQGDPSFVYKDVDLNAGNVNIGGYGLFG